MARPRTRDARESEAQVASTVRDIGCPRDEQVAAYLDGLLKDDELAEFEAHVADCERCHGFVTEYARAFSTLPAAGGDPSSLRQGARIGRYVIERPLGAGGMGVVYLARDPSMDRQVALKLVRPADLGERTARVRLLREAQALGRLAHPNVVVAHDVGVFEERVYVAMEYVRGKTLGEWLGERPRSIEQGMEVLLQAARGIAAAHDVGLVHRDFKPSNVMVGDDGRVRVLDFGLARASGADADEGVVAGGTAFEESATRTGTVVGTPRYMAPEQFHGKRADARSDQFAFAVTAFEVLHGSPPFKGSSVEELERAVTSGEIQPAESEVPRHLDEALRRALSADPDRRFADMAAFMRALLSPAPRSSAWVLAAVALVAALGLGRWVAQRPAPSFAASRAEVASAAATKESACTPRQLALVPAITPVDLLVAVDDAQAMRDIAADTLARTAKFVGDLRRASIDTRVILVASDEVCMPQPVGNGHCPKDEQPPTYHHVTNAAGDPLPAILQSHAAWKDMTRPAAKLHALVMSGGDLAPAIFDSLHARLAEIGEGAATMGIHALVPAMKPDNCRHCEGGCDHCNRCCPGCTPIIRAFGDRYMRANDPSGTDGDVCQDPSPFFEELQGNIELQVVDSCQYDLPAEVSDTRALALDFHRARPDERFRLPQHDEPACDPNFHGGDGDDGWYLDQAHPRRITLCMVTCARLNQSFDNRIEAVLDCPP